MAKPTGLNIFPQAGSYFTQLGVYHFTQYDSTNYYVHMKTNISVDINQMYLIECVGYNYGPAQNIRAGIVFHTQGGSLYQIGAENIYPGFTPQTVYMSSDRFVVIRYY